MIFVLAGANKARCSIRERNKFFYQYEMQAAPKDQGGRQRGGKSGHPV
jgi:hypothetical protein